MSEHVPRVVTPAVARGALRGAAFILVVSLTDLLLGSTTDDDTRDGWQPVLFLVVLLAYFSAGRHATRQAGHDPMRHGALAGLAAFAIWFALRLIVLAVTRDPLADGAGPAIFGHLLFGATFGMIGGLFAAREQSREAGLHEA